MTTDVRERCVKGKLIDADEWVYGDFVKVINGTCYVLRVLDASQPEAEMRVESFAVRSETVCEFTGASDSTKFPIFEGDVIIQAWDDYRSPAVYLIKWNSVSWIATNPALEGGCHNEGETLLGCMLDCSVVIGNVHDNPELVQMLELSRP